MNAGVLRSKTQSTAARQSTRTPSPTAFTAVLRSHFEEWSEGRSTLTAPDIYRELSNSKNRGEAGAALAALAYFAHGNHDEAAVSKDDLPQYEQAVAAGNAGHDTWDTQFQAGLGNLRAERTRGTVSAPLTLQDLAQGWLPDCYLLAALGGKLFRDTPGTQAIIPDRGAEQQQVIFPGYHQPQHVQVTDGEVAAFASGHPGNVEQLYVEKAAAQFLQSRSQASGESRQVMNPLYCHEMRGYPSAGITLVTGHDAFTVSLSDPRIDLDDLRTAFKASLAHTVVLATSDETFYPEHHAVSVLKFDPATDMVTLWNPNPNVQHAPSPDVTVKEGGLLEMSPEALQRHFPQLTIERPDTPANLDSYSPPQLPR